MARKTARSFGIGGVALVLFLLGPVVAYPAETPLPEATARQSVLILNSYHRGLQWSDDIVRGIEAALPAEVDLTVEYMDTKVYATPEYFRLLGTLYAHKYRRRRFDCIVSTDDNAFQFLLEHRDTLFPDTPVVFCGVNDFSDDMLVGHQDFTGLVETLDIRDSIEVGLRLRPRAKHVLLVTDNTVSGRSNRRYLEALARAATIPAELVFLDEGEGLDVPELLHKLEAAPHDSIVYYCDLFRDKHGALVRHERTLPLLSYRGGLPIFSQSSIYLGHGIVGGKLISGYYQGEMAGGMAARILGGEPASEIPIQRREANKYMFDYRELQRWGIPLSAIPKESIVVNEPTSLYHTHRGAIWATAAFLLLQSIVIVGLVLSVVLRRRAERELRENRRRLATLMSNLPGMAYRCRDDPDWTMEFVSEGCLALTGYQAADLIGSRRISYAEVIHPDDRERVSQEARAAIDAREPFTLVYRIVTAAREERHVWEQGRAVASSAGEVLALEGFIIDISERAVAERRIRESERRVRTILETAKEGYVEVSPGWDIRVVNPEMCAILGREASGIVGHRLHEFADARSREALLREEEESIGVQRGTYEVTFQRPDKTKVPCLINATPLFDDAGQPQGAFGMVSDVTGLKQAQERLGLFVTHAPAAMAMFDREMRYLVVSQRWREMYDLGETPLIGKSHYDMFPELPDRHRSDCLRALGG